MKKIWLISLLFLAWSCQTGKKTFIYDPSALLEERDLDTLVVSAPAISSSPQAQSPAKEAILERPRYNPSATRTNDLLHTKLEISFDWEQEQVLGRATLSLRPYFYPTQSLTLDAKNFEIRQVQMLTSQSDLTYEYDGQKLAIELDRTYTREEDYTISIDYVASPTETGGSAAITSDKGLFFINADGKDPDKPMQIWTQGETENNSRWFPTIDKPNERCTQEIFVTVDQRFKTLSNGLLVSSTDHEDGSRTDHWKMDQPHAPYLFMLAVGEYAVVRETWEELPVEYYVEPDFEKDAKAIFPHTVEMLSFFSEKLGIKYPWSKYAQVIVRDYVSGAMENTTAVVFGEFMQLPARELIDERFNEKIVAHELVHHWFGDLVTCESWANLPLNEGFANYGEYLWLEYKYGKDEADYHLLGEWNSYLATSDYRLHPLIHFGYRDRENMFDQHSYEKGGSVLHMLRNYIGDEAFFIAIQQYLEKFQYQAAEAHDLRLIFEKVTGEDLNWFFDQWFFEQGHPELDLSYQFIDSTGVLEFTVRQEQDPEYNLPVFKIPTELLIYTENEEPLRRAIVIDQREQTFRFELPSAPKFVNFDPEKALLARIREKKEDNEMIFQYQHASSYLDRYHAVIALNESDHPQRAGILEKALNDAHWTIRNYALQQFDTTNIAGSILEKVRFLAENDPHSIVRMNALDLLTELRDAESVAIVQRLLKKEQSYSVLTTGLFLLMEVDFPKALEAAEQFQDEENLYLLEAVEIILSESGDSKYLPFFEKNLTRFDGFSALAFVDSYENLLLKSELPVIMSGAETLRSLAGDQSLSYWIRMAGARTLFNLVNELKRRSSETKDAEQKKALAASVDSIKSMIQQLKDNEKDEKLIEIYKQLRP